MKVERRYGNTLIIYRTNIDTQCVCCWLRNQMKKYQRNGCINQKCKTMKAIQQRCYGLNTEKLYHQKNYFIIHILKIINNNLYHSY